MKPKAVISFASGILLVAAQAVAQQYAYIPIDVRCDSGATVCPVGLVPGGVARQTSVRGINARGEIVGFYIDAAGVQHGFLRQDGILTTIDFPLPGVRGTIANGINAQGEIVGQYVLPVNPGVPEDSPRYCPTNLPSGAANPACIKGFHYRHGHYSTLAFAGYPGAIAQRITSDGDIHGCLHGHDLGMSMYGATWRRSFAPTSSVEITEAYSLLPNGGELSSPMDVPMSMNNGGTLNGRSVVGLFTDMSGQQRGYLVRTGMFEAYDPVSDATLTAIWDMNAGGQFVGTYRRAGEAAARRHGFLDRGDGSSPVTLDVTIADTSGNTVTAFATIAFGINANGVIVGQYVLVPGGAVHGFMAVPVGSN